MLAIAIVIVTIVEAVAVVFAAGYWLDWWL